MLIEELKKYKKILILGYGLEGKATEEFLKAKVPSAEIGIADQSTNPKYLEEQEKYDLVVKTSGIPKRLVTRPYTTGTNIFFANAKAPIIGITGTKGKSTTTSLIYAIMKEAGYDARLIGNIGIPMVRELLRPETEKTIYVCELSSYQLDDIKYSPHVSVILNLFPEHMDYHGSFDLYKTAKKNIVAYSTAKDYFVYNPEYPELMELSKKTKAKPIPFISELPFPKDIIPLMGEHNVGNVNTAVTVGNIFKIDPKVMAEAVRKFVPLHHRLEPVGTFKGIRFYDDAISTTPESTIQAIKSIPNIGTIFLGGKDRGYEFSSLARELVSSLAKNIVLFPESGAKIKEALIKAGGNFNFLETSDMKAAVEFAYKNTKPGEACVLSCASPSYSIWKNFEEKGDLFKQFVREFKV